MSNVHQFTFEAGTEYIKVHGLQRSGTNYLGHLIEENFENTKSLMNVGGWKHGPYCAPWSLGREVHVLTITKNPYSWLVSLYYYWSETDIGPDLTNVSFGEFVRSKAVFEQQQGIPYLMLASNPVQHWNSMNYHWLSIRMNQKKSLVIPYEALLVNVGQALEVIAADLGVKVKAKPVVPNSIMQVGEEQPKQTDEAFYKSDYYLKQHYLEEYDDDLLRFVNSQLDPEVMSTLGYSYVKDKN